MTDWVRLWHDMPMDPKWRVVARKSGQPLTAVLSVFVFLMTNASANADERGVVRSWDDEDVAAALDLDTPDVRAILDAMQGKVLDGERLTGWEKRQPKREDASTERVRKHREVKSASAKRGETQCNAPEAEADTDISDANASAEAAPAAGPDYRDLLWTEGVASLKRQTGKTEGSVRSFIGKCLGACGDDCRLVLTKIQEAERDRIGDPAAWISKAVRPTASKPKRTGDKIFNRITERESHGFSQPH